jgi:ABC-type lipoprotein export system ATPase subunit
VFSILRDLADQGRTILVVTHDVGLALRTDRRINIVDGRVDSVTINPRPTAEPSGEVQGTQAAASMAAQ